MKKVYIVEAGEYSDRYIAAIFTSERTAKKWCSLRNPDGYERYYVSEYAVNEFVEQARTGVFPYWVQWEDGRVWCGYDDDEGFQEHGPELVTGAGWGGRIVWRLRLNARDQDHALKIASDKFAQYFAEQGGIA